jgi:fucose 4-O-acetylase-like acetyltransferase
MKISLSKKIKITVVFAFIYLGLCLLAAKLTGVVFPSLIVAALFAWPFGWMVGQTWKDD